MFEYAVGRSECINSVVAVIVGGQIGAAETSYGGPKKAVERVVLGRHVFDRDTVAADHYPRAKFEFAVQNHRIAIHAAQGDARCGDEYRLVVFTLVDQHEITRIRRIDAVLNRRVVLRHAAGYSG